MAAIGTADVAYVLKNQRKLSDSRNFNRVQLTFGDSAGTYSAGGVPIEIGKLGCPVIIESMAIVDVGTSGYGFSYDSTNKKIVMFQAPAQTHTHDIKVIASQTYDATIGLNGSVLGKNTATNVVVAGANSTASGGIVSATLAAAAMAEPTSVAFAQQVIIVEVVGY